MFITLLGIKYTGSDIERLIMLRSMEWDAFPVFATRAVAPIALFWIGWWQLAMVLAAASILWCPIRNRIANPELAALGSVVGNLFISLIANVAIATVLIM